MGRWLGLCKDMPAGKQLSRRTCKEIPCDRQGTDREPRELEEGPQEGRDRRAGQVGAPGDTSGSYAQGRPSANVSSLTTSFGDPMGAPPPP